MSVRANDVFSTRPLVAKDIRVVNSIEQASYDFPWSENIFRDCLRVGYRCFAATDETDNVVGYGLLSVVMEESHVLNLCVDPACRRQGVARLLLERMMTEARKNEAESIMLEVRPSNQPARALYASYGFSQVATRPGYYPGENGREDAWLLSRRVDRPIG